MIHLSRKRQQNELVKIWDNAKLIEMRENNQLTNLAIVCEDGIVRVHSHIMISASSKFRKTFVAGSEGMRGPRLLIVSGISSADLKNVIDFLYVGEVRFPVKNLEGFLRTCQYIGIDDDDTPGTMMQRGDRNVSAEWCTIEEVTVQPEDIPSNREIMDLLSPTAAGVVSRILKDSLTAPSYQFVNSHTVAINEILKPIAEQCITPEADDNNTHGAVSQVKAFNVHLAPGTSQIIKFVEPEYNPTTFEVHQPLNRSNNNIMKKSRKTNPATNQRPNQYPANSSNSTSNLPPPITAPKKTKVRKNRFCIEELVKKVINNQKSLPSTEIPENRKPAKLKPVTTQNKGLTATGPGTSGCIGITCRNEPKLQLEDAFFPESLFLNSTESILPPLPGAKLKKTAPNTKLSRKTGMEMHVDEAIELVVTGAAQYLQELERKRMAETDGNAVTVPAIKRGEKLKHIVKCSADEKKKKGANKEAKDRKMKSKESSSSLQIKLVPSGVETKRVAPNIQNSYDKHGYLGLLLEHQRNFVNDRNPTLCEQ